VAAAKKKPQIQASEVLVDKRTLRGVLDDLAEQIKANDARYAERAVRIDERCARAEEMAGQALERSARAEEGSRVALESISALLKDLRALAQRTHDRLDVLENAAE
jgi:hypothetical protein